jgi:capsular exopolysaccharide synthesis family protein
MIDNQGKSTLAIKLGETFKDMHDKTIIIDFNIHKPKIHNIFKLNNNIGLGTYLSGGHRLYEVIQSTGYKNLDAITIGLRPPNPSKLLFSDRFPTLLSELKKNYSHIIIDTSSLEASYETLNIMKYSDINLFLFRIKTSKKESLDSLNFLAKEHDIKNIGIILNRYS